jgi:hypothetical protein
MVYSQSHHKETSYEYTVSAINTKCWIGKKTLEENGIINLKKYVSST